MGAGVRCPLPKRENPATVPSAAPGGGQRNVASPVITRFTSHPVGPPLRPILDLASEGRGAAEDETDKSTNPPRPGDQES